MRSSKKRSRSNQNRPRSLGNIVNRVFDSSGPEGKVRGTPQQIIEKYQALARDAQLSNDRVAAENFLQHAEHYTRMLAEAQRELAAEQEARQQQYQQNGGQQNGNGNGQHGNRERNEYRDRGGDRNDRGDYRAPGTEDQPPTGEVIDFGGDEAGLVDLPEARPTAAEDAPRAERNERRDRPQQNDRRDRPQGDRQQGERPQGDRRDNRRDRDDRRREAEPAPAELPAFITGAAEPAAVTETPAAEAPVQSGAATGADAAAEPKARRPRAPRKPRAEADAGSAPETAGPEAAE